MINLVNNFNKNMKRYGRILIFLSNLTFAKNENPFIGEWLLQKEGGCQERYQFLKKGKMLSRSRNEINERTYSLKAIDNNIFSLTVKTISTNNLESCSGIVEHAYIGIEFQLFFELNDKHNEFYIYFDFDESNKLGPFTKLVPIPSR